MQDKSDLESKIKVSEKEKCEVKGWKSYGFDIDSRVAERVIWIGNGVGITEINVNFWQIE